MLFPGCAGTNLCFDEPVAGEPLPLLRPVVWGHGAAAGDGLSPRPGRPLLIEGWRPDVVRPGLAGHRVVADSGSGFAAGRSWTTKFLLSSISRTDRVLTMSAEDRDAGLGLETEVESLLGGAIRIRHTVTNRAPGHYLLDELSVSVPIADDLTEVLDFTGRHGGERSPQRHHVADGVWLRESRAGKPGCGSATMLVAGTSGFGFAHGDLVGLAVAWGGNSRIGIQRGPQGVAALFGGELLQPGEVVLGEGESYRTPWVFVVAAGDGLDGVAGALHDWQRSLPAHPGPQPATLNVWEAVYFDHRLEKLEELARLAARVGMERFVLDDGWFHLRRGDHAGLGDWWVDDQVWPEGLRPLADTVHGFGMAFGLWFEPEMVNPDSDLFRAHPEWVLQPAGRLPAEQRRQQVLDLTQDAAWRWVRDRIDAVLTEASVDFVKWDHNRDLLEAGSTAARGAPAYHAQNVAYLRLLDDLRERHPQIAWESCASGGGRIDLGTIEHVQRFWTSDMTDALARQRIQRWTVQLIAPEYLGAHISAPGSHQTGRHFDLDFRAGTALFGSFGIEWDLTAATEEDLDRIAEWTRIYRAHRALLQGGRTFRCDLPGAEVHGYGVVAPDGGAAILALAQLDESVANRGVTLRIPGLRPDASYRVSWLGPVDLAAGSGTPALDPAGPLGDHPISGAALAETGLWLPRRKPETITVMHIAVAEPE
ncbi:alpha-galactosidase [Flexivirga caeni]|uniref:alpha-galactosidase n=1 Tax=Flexivirga caeni TaxID=2294115 RepID=A0A3M9ME59_9MICO|nr:alpha-galactosidase [Flexivirga caeni]RNI23839.1 alpha-galactosidase [Flexivirga caeni]